MYARNSKRKVIEEGMNITYSNKTENIYQNLKLIFINNHISCFCSDFFS